MNRHQRRAEGAARQKQRAGPKTRGSIVSGTAWYWIPVGGMAAVKDAWQPFELLLHVMSDHIWMFPTGWLFTIAAHWLIIDNEVARQRRHLTDIRTRQETKRDRNVRP